MSACVCKHCVDPRETGILAQHGITGHVYQERDPGCLSDIVAPVMLAELGKHPVSFIQGHDDCAAMKVLKGAYGKKSPNITEKKFLKSHGDVLTLVMKQAVNLPEEEQLYILAQACTLKDTNDLLAVQSVLPDDQKFGAIYAYNSLTPKERFAKGEVFDPAEIELEIYNEKTGAFERSLNNVGIRISDLVDLGTGKPKEDRYMITKQIDLETFVKGAVLSSPKHPKPGCYKGRALGV
ncbi:MAG: hypothetical protein P4M13_09360 [Alphaproteobacteria bacterium]|nr:hypothetical protein [Alphaproteobacteria bacterium]